MTPAEVSGRGPISAVQYHEIARAIRECITELMSVRARAELMFLAARYERLAEFAEKTKAPRG